MAKELAKLHHERSEAETYRVLRERSQLDSQAVAALIESQSQRAREDRLELQRLKDQLELMQIHEQESLAKNAFQHDVPWNSPRKFERNAQKGMSSPLKSTEVPRLDLSKMAQSKDGVQISDLRVFQVLPLFIFWCCLSTLMFLSRQAVIGNMFLVLFHPSQSLVLTYDFSSEYGPASHRLLTALLLFGSLFPFLYYVSHST